MNWKFWKTEAQNLTLKDSDLSESLNIGGKAQSGAFVNDASALAQSAVYACNRVLAETVASLPLKVYRTTDKGREEVEHPLNSLLTASCNGEQTGFELREFQMMCLGLRGNAFAQKVYNNRGQIAQINPLNANYMDVYRNKGGQLAYRYTEPKNENEFTSSDIWRISGFGSNGVLGLSPITLFRESIGASIALEGHSSSAFKNGITPSVVLSHPGSLTDESHKRLKDQLDSGHAGFANAGKPFLTEGGMSVNVVGMTHQDAQFIESRKFQAEDIARIYRIPPHMIGILDKATFSNIEQQSIDFVVNTIRPWLVRIEATMSRDLLTQSERDQGLYLSHTVEGLLRGDTTARNAAYAVGVDKGWITRNEVRRKENMNPIDGLDDPVLPVNIETLKEREKRFSDALVNMLAEQEINALRGERNKGGDDLGERVTDFYARFANKIINLGVPKDAAHKYTIDHISLFDQGKYDQIERSTQKELAEIL